MAKESRSPTYCPRCRKTVTPTARGNCPDCSLYLKREKKPVNA